MKRILSLFLLSSFFIASYAQKPVKQNASQIYESVQKLNFLGSVLYLAAHPDDENTRLIAYFANHVKARTAYMSLTRGDGGQNLIGSELRELLGVIRTQELLAARGVDGGEQFFSRANDFGFSKHPTETFEIWDKDEVLKDLVSVIRKFQPDLIINRFNHRTPGTTHGHHTASAMLGMEAFDLANDKNYKTHYGNIWQPKRLFFNTSWWFYGSREKFAKADKSKMLHMDVGVYYPLKGLSNNEVASMASSQHLCQGFGRLSQRGSQEEYIELLKGDMPNNNNPFDGIDTSWNRVKGGKAIGNILNKVEQNFDFKNPSSHLPELLKAYILIQQLENEHWKNLKTKEIKQIISSVLGLYLEASAEASSTTKNGELAINLEALNRGKANIKLNSVVFSIGQNTYEKNTTLSENKKVTFKEVLKIPATAKMTTPYWLDKSGTLGMYTVEEKSLIGDPETKPLTVTFSLTINNTTIPFDRPIVHRFSKPDKGELYEPFQVLPKVTSSIEEKVLIFSDAKSKDVAVKVRANANTIKGEVSLEHPKGWSVNPAKADITIAQKGGEQTVVFKVTPPATQSEGSITPKVTSGGKVFDKELIEISYNHIPKQSVLLPSQSKVVRLNIKKKGEKIGYIQGAGDKIPESLRQIGYAVDELKENEITTDNLKKYDAVVLGIRAYNVNERAKFYQNTLHEYVKNGGTLMVQYNTNRRVKVAKVAPYKLKLSRDRVTDENAKVTVLAKNHEVINYPNKITDTDFTGWVQERGLYFPNEWGKEFTPILSMHDKGESAKKGSLLVAKYGKGHFIYTGLSFFRELPAGVSGAFKLYANLLSVGKNTKKIKG